MITLNSKLNLSLQERLSTLCSAEVDSDQDRYNAVTV